MVNLYKSQNLGDWLKVKDTFRLACATGVTLSQNDNDDKYFKINACI